MNTNTRRITYLALFTAAALVVHLVESALPPLLPFAPGAKMGLSNLVTIVALLLLGVPDAFAVLLARCLLGAALGGGVWSLSYSLPAGIAALAVETVAVKLCMPRLTITSISFAGAMVHNAVQLAIASFQVGVSLIPALPLFLLASLLAGLFVGRTAWLILRYLPEKFYLIPSQSGKHPKEKK